MNWKCLPSLVLFACLVGCQGRNASREDVQSALKESVSLASEAEIFVDYLGQRRSTSRFAAGHLKYLHDEINRRSQEISNLRPDPDLVKPLNVERVQLRLLAVQIDQVSRNLEQPSVLKWPAKEIHEIRSVLLRTSDSL